jgi:glycosyltransferase involved in cell wall biosynthesis
MKLSVCMLAYNQKDLLAEAIESVVTQKTNFEFEIIVCDDASTDGSVEVLRDYAHRYPLLVKPVFRDQNVGHYVNYVDAHNRATGEYVAHLDGDDLFLPGKLQKQVDFLDAHPAVSVAWHAVKLIDGDSKSQGRISVRESIAPDGYVSLEDVLEIGTVGVHSSTMYRASARTTRQPAISPIDWFYAVEFLSRGQGYQMAEELGVYRRAEAATMSTNPASAQKVRRHFADMILYYIERFPEHRKKLFTLSLLYVLCDIRARAGSVTAMLHPLWAARSWLAPREFFSALHRFRAVSRAFRGIA